MGLLDSLLGKKKKPGQQPHDMKPPPSMTADVERPRAEVLDLRDESKLPENAVLLGGQGRVEVRGEERRQEAFDRICGGKCEEGHLRRVFAILKPDFDNEYDKNAVEVHVDGEMVGYMAKESAAEYAPIAKLLHEKGKVGAARGFIKGGWRRGSDEGFYGIELELSSTEKLLKTRKITSLST